MQYNACIDDLNDDDMKPSIITRQRVQLHPYSSMFLNCIGNKVPPYPKPNTDGIMLSKIQVYSILKGTCGAECSIIIDDMIL